MEFFLSVIGMVMVIEGIPYFAFPDRMKSIMKMAQLQPDNVLRIFGVVLMATGLIIVFLARKGAAF